MNGVHILLKYKSSAFKHKPKNLIMSFLKVLIPFVFCHRFWILSWIDFDSLTRVFSKVLTKLEYLAFLLLWTKLIHPSLALFSYTYVIRQEANRRIPIYFYSSLQVLYGHGITEKWRKRVRSEIPLASLRCSHVLLFEGMFKVLFEVKYQRYLCQ